ncbi:SCP-2 sterol transfer family protein [Mycobacterium ulcerans str. Harvey]|uniref:SCP-2 sterol transfer family protein n=1 Tax=Mycobacterium ulcerans str. Harvey TaxID=1299332 RepID=A0ABN0QWG1_MYCUL|nr:SCP-2 sterol transfer family protein [Mycobacterium ulcerans str. Harvey]
MIALREHHPRTIQAASGAIEHRTSRRSRINHGLLQGLQRDRQVHRRGLSRCRRPPTVGPKFRAANIVMRVVYTNPDCELTVALRDDFRVVCGPSNLTPDVTMTMPADVADQFWRGNYNLTIGLAKGQVKAKGPIGKILRLIPLTKPLFGSYREKIAEKDREQSRGGLTR